MKKLFLVLLLTSGTAFAEQQPNIFDQFRNCASISNKAVQYATMAKFTPDAKLREYQNFVLTEVNQIPDEKSQRVMMFLAEFAWKHKSEHPMDVGQSVYEECVRSMGTST